MAIPPNQRKLPNQRVAIYLRRSGSLSICCERHKIPQIFIQLTMIQLA